MLLEAPGSSTVSMCKIDHKFSNFPPLSGKAAIATVGDLPSFAWVSSEMGYSEGLIDETGSGLSGGGRHGRFDLGHVEAQRTKARKLRLHRRTANQQWVESMDITGPRSMIDEIVRLQAIST